METYKTFWNHTGLSQQLVCETRVEVFLLTQHQNIGQDVAHEYCTEHIHLCKYQPTVLEDGDCHLIQLLSTSQY